MAMLGTSNVMWVGSVSGDAANGAATAIALITNAAVTNAAARVSCCPLDDTGDGGGAEGNRTPDLLIANEALSQLSYSPIAGYAATLTDAGREAPLMIGGPREVKRS